MEYRIWDTKKERMFKVLLIDYNSTTSFIEAIDKYGNIEEYPRNSEILMSSTSVKDNRGDSIFEGDIISNNRYVGYVEWSRDMGAFMIRFLNLFDLTEDFLYKYIYQGGFQIIGNIHEDKDFLESTRRIKKMREEIL